MKRILNTIRANAHSIAALLTAGPGLYLTFAGIAWGDHNLFKALLLFFGGMILLAVGFGQMDKASDADEPFVRWIEEEASNAE